LVQPDRVKLWSYVGWWEALLISLAVIFPAVASTDGRSLGLRLPAVASAAVVGHLLTSWLNQRRRRRACAESERRELARPPGEARLGLDWRGLVLVVLALTSLLVATGIVTAASRGMLFRASIGWGAITLIFMLSACWYSLRRPLLNPVALWFVAPLLMLSASLWLMAVTG
jgi:hypothetical protein